MTQDPVAALNPEQARAVQATEGPVLVLAGAGTGKTRVITVRIAYLIQGKVPPSAILAVTFTNKAAREMKERVGGLVPKKVAAELTIGTFHSLCVKLLREHGTAIGLTKGFSICDAPDQLTAVKGVMRELKLPEASLNPGQALARISLLKNKLVSAEQAADQAFDATDELVAAVYARYDQALRRCRSVDFDDLLLLARDLLRRDDGVRAALAQRYRYLMVDEYQDTNGPQYEIVRLLAAARGNLCVVGDDDQSIYGWRGADVEKILGFEQDFPGATVVRLETNYRSTGAILAAANKVIAHNLGRHDKALRTAAGEGEPVHVVETDEEAAEAAFIVGDIVRRLQDGQLASPGEVGILYRTQVQPRPIEAALRSARLPYVLVGGLSFFDRKEVRDVLAYLRLLANPTDEASFLRIVNRPARGMGKSSVDKVLALSTEEGIPVLDALHRAREEGLLSEAAKNGAEDLMKGLREVGAQLGQGRHLVHVIKNLLEEVGYQAEVNRCYPDERTRRDRWQGVLEVLDMAENYALRARRPTIGDFLERVALVGTDDPTSEDSSKRGQITLMTLHAAKGLEFPEVYLAGAEENLLPHSRSVEEDTVEEERRLMYVGITRARRRLTISHAKSRSRYGHRADSHKSRFLFEMTGEEPPENWRPAGASAIPEPRAKGGKAKGGKAKAGKTKAAKTRTAKAKPSAAGKAKTGATRSKAATARVSKGSKKTAPAKAKAVKPAGKKKAPGSRKTGAGAAAKAPAAKAKPLPRGAPGKGRTGGAG